MGMDGFGQVLVVREGEEEQRTSLQGVFHLEERDPDAGEGSRGSKHQAKDCTGENGLEEQGGLRASCKRSEAKRSNTSIRDLFENGACTSAVLELALLRTRKVGIVREGILNGTRVYMAFSHPSFLPSSSFRAMIGVRNLVFIAPLPRQRRWAFYMTISWSRPK